MVSYGAKVWSFFDSKQTNKPYMFISRAKNHYETLRSNRIERLPNHSFSENYVHIHKSESSYKLKKNQMYSWYLMTNT